MINTCASGSMIYNTIHDVLKSITQKLLLIKVLKYRCLGGSTVALSNLHSTVCNSYSGLYSTWAHGLAMHAMSKLGYGTTCCYSRVPMHFFAKQRTLLIAKASIKGGHNTSTERNNNRTMSKEGI